MITIPSQTIWFFNLSYWFMTMAIQSPSILPSRGTLIQMTTDICFNLLFHQCLLSDEIVVIVQSLSHVWDLVTPWTAACQDSLSFTISWNLLGFMSLELMMPSNHLILCCPLLLLHSIFPSIRVFSNDSALRIMWPKYWSFLFSNSPSNEYSGLIFFRIDGSIFMLSMGLSRVFSSTTIRTHQFFGAQSSLWSNS